MLARRRQICAHFEVAVMRAMKLWSRETGNGLVSRATHIPVGAPDGKPAIVGRMREAAHSRLSSPPADAPKSGGANSAETTSSFLRARYFRCP